MANLVDLYIVYRILRMLTTPFENWEAYKTGVIDKDGKIIVKPNDRTPDQKDSYTKFDNLMLKLKQVLGTIPFGRTKLASYAAALLLLKEQDTLTEENIEEKFLDFYKKRYLTEKWSDKYKRSINCDNPKGFSQKAHCQGKKKNEEIANVASSGQVAGLGEHPPVGKKAQTSLIRRGKFANTDTFIVSSDLMKKARLGKKKYVRYEKYVGNDEIGMAIREFGLKYPKKPIILQDEKTGGMIFLRYGRSGLFEESNPRIPRKKGQPANSDKHSDLYTDENPEGTIKGLKFATKEDAEDSVAKIKSSGRTHAHKIQAAVAMEQRAKVMGKNSAASVYRKFINSMKEKTKKKVNEEVTRIDLDRVESYADKLFKSVGIDIEFTRHFLDRVNDARNKKEITIQELALLFKKTFEKYGKKIASLGDDAEAVINDMKSDINMPFVLDLNKKTKELDLIAKTVMRKKNFMTRNLKLKV